MTFLSLLLTHQQEKPRKPQKQTKKTPTQTQTNKKSQKQMFERNPLIFLNRIL